MNENLVNDIFYGFYSGFSQIFKKAFNNREKLLLLSSQMEQV